MMKLVQIILRCGKHVKHVLLLTFYNQWKLAIFSDDMIINVKS